MELSEEIVKKNIASYAQYYKNVVAHRCGIRRNKYYMQIQQALRIAFKGR